MASSIKVSTNPKTLCEWVRNFRIKKIEMKRKLRGNNDLRVCAILTRALNSAEQELRRKQQERFNRWISLQSRLSNNNSGELNATNCNGNLSYFTADDSSEELKRQEIMNLWRCELKGLDDFMKNMSTNPS